MKRPGRQTDRKYDKMLNETSWTENTIKIRQKWRDLTGKLSENAIKRVENKATWSEIAHPGDPILRSWVPKPTFEQPLKGGLKGKRPLFDSHIFHEILRSAGLPARLGRQINRKYDKLHRKWSELDGKLTENIIKCVENEATWTAKFQKIRANAFRMKRPVENEATWTAN